ncbi:tyrosine-type recombinase/integrase [Synechococcus sp. CCY9201]|uniref:tyrosine-type recombinase/integrase n=1 Tax=Synechococcus sp. CCY9201 TaxID=174697 RepID=UPI002B1F257F|nr:tyrosine-type recombinase/integrase [Synechococcus sp. CCY9201]MEA5472972.1 tyrosine-type recombinase/integrase [Synechococcus sp. CCY9201]
MPKTCGSGQARVLSPEQLDQLIEAAPNPEHRALWSVMRFTGSRTTETLRLHWGAIHSDRIVFAAATTKTRRTREPLIAPRLGVELDQFRLHWEERHRRPARNGSLLFLSPGSENQPMTRQAADKALRRAVAALGPDFPSGVSLHSFRRSLATTMAQRGASLRTVQRFTGHASLGQLQNYIDVAEADEEAALRLLD